MIAKGDFTQKVDFLHDFSEAFNSMVRELDEAKKTLVSQTTELQTANASLFINEQQYKSLIHESPVSICVVNEWEYPSGKFGISQPPAGIWFHHDGYTATPSVYIRPDNRAHFLEKVALYTEYGENWNRFEEEMIRSDGSEIVVDMIVSNIIIDNEPAILFVIIDITEKIRRNEKILTSLQEKDILLKEVYHRVKNNMQIIWSLLSLQAKTVEDEKIKGYFTECQNRVKSLALVHENLYRTDNLRDIEYGQYLKQFTSHLFKTYRVHADHVTLTIESENETITLAKAVPCSLIVNELVSNSLKYAFGEGQTGSITIQFSLNTVSHQYILQYRDTGPGILGPDLPETAKTLGMQLIYGLTRQLKGTVFFENDKGVHYLIQFPSDSIP